MNSEPTPPLAGVTIVDLSRVLAGPFCTLVLAQLGARVIKVEMPGAGDDARAFGPFVNGKSLYFAAINYDKESIALDLKQPGDRNIFERLLSRADVLVENFRPGTMEALGYGWQSLHMAYPQLIYAAVSGFGGSGPYSQRPAYDMVVQGMGGIMSITGHAGSPPTRVGASIGDLVAALYLATGICGALYRREQGGEAVKLDLAMLDCQVAILENALVRYLNTGTLPGPQGSRHPEIAPFQAYRAADGYLVIAAGNDRLFALLANTIGRKDLVDNPSYATNELRRVNVDRLQDDLEQTLTTRGVREWLHLLINAGVPCGPVNSVADVAADPQVAARNMIVTIDDPTLGRFKVAGSPIKIVGLDARPDHRPPPELDADREAILAELASGRG
jgi:CoA:oxalate CoA-transferase